MKKYDGVPVWIIFTAVGFSIGISIWALIMANSEPYSFFRYEFNYTKLVELSGLMFSVIGVIFTVYFVVIGINAKEIEKKISKRQEQIEKLDKEIKNEQSQIKSVKKQIENVIESEMNQQDEMYGHLLDQAKNISDANKRKRTIDSLNLSRARLATRSKFLSKNKRLQRMPLLDMLGDSTDIADLVRIINDPSEDKDIIESTKMRKEAIEKRLGIV